MKKDLPIILIGFLIISNIFTFAYFSSKKTGPLAEEKFEAYVEAVRNYQGDLVSLPEPKKDGFVSVEKVIAQRRSGREYSQDPLTLAHVSQFLWAAQGITSEDEGKRAAPSARELYPLNIYVVAKNVTDLQKGVYHYIVEEHKLGRLLDEDEFEAFFEAAQQPHPKNAALTLVITANYPKVAQKFKGEAVKQMALQESGHVGQNLYLQAESLELAMAVMGSFSSQGVKDALRLPVQETVVYLVPIGHRMLE